MLLGAWAKQTIRKDTEKDREKLKVIIKRWYGDPECRFYLNPSFSSWIHLWLWCPVEVSAPWFCAVCPREDLYGAGALRDVFSPGSWIIDRVCRSSTYIIEVSFPACMEEYGDLLRTQNAPNSAWARSMDFVIWVKLCCPSVYWQEEGWRTWKDQQQANTRGSAQHNGDLCLKPHSSVFQARTYTPECVWKCDV